MNKNRIVITLGDPWGIGPEITVKALMKASLSPEQVVIVGPQQVWQEACVKWGDGVELASTLLPVAFQGTWEPGKPFSGGGQVVLDSLQTALLHIKAGEAGAIVTSPINKSIIQEVDHSFVGHTEYLGAFFGVKEPTMFFVGPTLKTGLVTTHLSMRDLPAMITRERVFLHLQHLAAYLKAIGKPDAKIGVCGLNPHAGEMGAFGREEITEIGPAVEDAVASGIAAEGPFPADTLYKRGLDGTYEIILAMYHDQALALFKTTDQNRGVNVTLGLPILRTSPDHGTAYDIAGKDIADPSSMLEAIRLAAQYCAE